MYGIRNQWQDFQENVEIMLGNGRKTSFSLDHWWVMAASNPHTGVIIKVAFGMEIGLGYILGIPKYQLNFVWLVTQKACLTQENLKRRCIQIYSRCMHCGQNGENIDHLFMLCSTTTNLWHMTCVV